MSALWLAVSKSIRKRFNRASKRLQGFERKAPILFILPAIILATSVWVYPLLYSLNVSTYKWNLVAGEEERIFVGTGNYTNIITKESDIRDSVKVTLLFTVSAVAIEFTLGLALAVTLNLNIHGKKILRALILAPMMMTPVVAGAIWKNLFNADYGAINYFLSLIHLSPRIWLGQPNTALQALIIVDVWQNTPFMTLMFLAGLQCIPQEYYEVAAVEGGNSINQFWYVTIPFLAPLMGIALFFRVIVALRTFDIVFMITQGGPGASTEFISMYIYKYGFRVMELGYTAALSLMLLVATMILCMGFIYATRRR